MSNKCPNNTKETLVSDDKVKSNDNSVYKPLNVKCRFCGYDGTWTEKERPRRNPVEIDNVGVASILCSKCGRRTVLK